MISVLTRITEVWGSRSSVAHVLFNECFRLSDSGDSDDQVRWAMACGLMAGQATSPEDCIARFESWVATL